MPESPRGAPPRDGRHEVTVVVTSVGERQGAIDGDPVLEVELLVSEDGQATAPLATSLRVPRAVVTRFVPGARFSAERSFSDPLVLDVNWSTL